MEALKEKILKEGKVREGNILKVDCFLNHQMDIKFLNEVGKEFRKRFEGEKVDKSKVEKEFFLKSKSVSGKLFSILTQIPMEYMRVTESIIKYAKETLNEELSENIYLTLTDHISFSIARQEKGLPFSNALLWEIKRFYKEEYKIGLKVLDKIKEKFDIELLDDEAGFIALHIVNAQLDETISVVYDITKVCRK